MSSELRIVNALKKYGILNDEFIKCDPKKYLEFTLDEFLDFTKKILNTESGYFLRNKHDSLKNYYIPFSRNGENFYLCIRHNSCSFMTESYFKKNQNYLVEKFDYEEREDYEEYEYEIGGEG